MIKRIISAALALLMLAVSLLLSSCLLSDILDNISDKETTTATKTPLNLPHNSFYSDNGCLPLSPFVCAYRIENGVMMTDIDSAELTLYFGHIILNNNSGRSYPEFDIRMNNEEKDTVIVKNFDEELVSQKYYVEYSYNEEHAVNILTYSYWEIFTIPKELFVGEQGSISISIWATQANTEEAQCSPLIGTVVYYRVDGDNVYLALTPYKLEETE